MTAAFLQRLDRQAGNRRRARRLCLSQISAQWDEALARLQRFVERREEM